MCVRHLFISPGHNYFGHHEQPPGQHPVLERDEIECVAGRGISGDRFFGYRKDYKGQITFFAWEVLEQLRRELGLADAHPSGTRRNVITEGIDLNALVGQEFEMQGVRFLGVEECRPCYWMNNAFHHEVAELWLKGKGGLRARILTSGVLRRETGSTWRLVTSDRRRLRKVQGEFVKRKSKPPAKGTVPSRPSGADTAFGRPRNFLGNQYVYAVISQRARGLSLGINLTPDKRCNFDCVYCEINRAIPGFSGRIDIGVMSSELAALLNLVRQKRLRELDWFRNVPPELLELKEVALSGDGEPTLCPDFAAVVEAVVRLRVKPAFPFKIVLITNTAGLDRAEVQRGLRLLATADEVWVKLDAGTQGYMNKVNRPDISLRKVLHNILAIGRERPVVIQSLFPLIGGEGPSRAEIQRYVQRLRQLKAAGAQITLVQIYSAHRPPHHPDCAHLPLKDLSFIARRVRRVARLKAEVF